MKKEEKQGEIDRLRDKLVRSRLTMVAEFSGLSVPEMQEVKGRLRAASGEFTVVKNTLAARAVLGTPVALVHDYFQGQTAVAFSYGDPLAPAKALKQVLEKQKKLKMKAGMMEGQVIFLPGLMRLADLPSRPVLYGQLVRQMQAPLVHWVGGLNAIIGQWVRALAAVHEKRVALSGPDTPPG